MRATPKSWTAGVGCLLAASCGGRALPPAGAVFTDGSRLKAIWEQAPGAPKRQVGWYDTALETPCAFVYPTGSGISHASADKQYCVPTSGAAVALDGTGLFADAACTLPAVTAACGSRFAATTLSWNDCTEPMRLFKTGASIVLENTYSRGEVGCVPNGQKEAPDGIDVYALGDEIALTTLVSGTVVIPTGGGPRIRPVALLASDGASQQIDAWDRDRGEAVAVPDWGLENAEISKWEPASPASNYLELWRAFYSDGNCSNWAAVAESCGGLDIKSLTQSTTIRCSGSAAHAHYEVGAALDAGAAHLVDLVTGSCRLPSDDEVPSRAELRFFTPGAPIPDSAFADAQVIEQGTDRIRLQIPASNDGPVDTGAGLYFDGFLGLTCTPRPSADGSLRCLPTTGTVIPDLYADPSCTVPVASFAIPVQGCPTTPPTVASIMQPRSAACGPPVRYRTYQVAGPHAGDVYQRWAANNCVYTSTVFGAFPLFDVGLELPPDAFVPIATSDHYVGR